MSTSLLFVLNIPIPGESSSGSVREAGLGVRSGIVVAPNPERFPPGAHQVCPIIDMARPKVSSGQRPPNLGRVWIWLAGRR